MKKTTKICLIVVSSVVFLIIGFIFAVWQIVFPTSTNNSLSDYTLRRETIPVVNSFMPSIESLPDFLNIYYEYRNERMGPFVSESMILSISYDQETYLLEKEKINAYSYIKEPILQNYSGRDRGLKYYSLPENEFSINSFEFRVLDFEALDPTFFNFFPKYIGMIATSNEKNSIVYLFFKNDDLDYISEVEPKGEMARFIKEYYKYDW